MKDLEFYLNKETKKVQEDSCTFRSLMIQFKQFEICLKHINFQGSSAKIPKSNEKQRKGVMRMGVL